VASHWPCVTDFVVPLVLTCLSPNSTIWY